MTSIRPLPSSRKTDARVILNSRKSRRQAAKDNAAVINFRTQLRRNHLRCFDLLRQTFHREVTRLFKKQRYLWTRNPYDWRAMKDNFMTVFEHLLQPLARFSSDLREWHAWAVQDVAATTSTASQLLSSMPSEAPPPPAPAPVAVPAPLPLTQAETSTDAISARRISMPELMSSASVPARNTDGGHGYARGTEPAAPSFCYSDYQVVLTVFEEQMGVIDRQEGRIDELRLQIRKLRRQYLLELSHLMNLIRMYTQEGVKVHFYAGIEDVEDVSDAEFQLQQERMKAELQGEVDRLQKLVTLLKKEVDERERKLRTMEVNMIKLEKEVLETRQQQLRATPGAPIGGETPVEYFAAVEELRAKMEQELLAHKRAMAVRMQRLESALQTVIEENLLLKAGKTDLLTANTKALETAYENLQDDLGYAYDTITELQSTVEVTRKENLILKYLAAGGDASDLPDALQSLVELPPLEALPPLGSLPGWEAYSLRDTTNLAFRQRNFVDLHSTFEKANATMMKIAPQDFGKGGMAGLSRALAKKLGLEGKSAKEIEELLRKGLEADNELARLRVMEMSLERREADLRETSADRDRDIEGLEAFREAEKRRRTVGARLDRSLTAVDERRLREREAAAEEQELAAKAGMLRRPDGTERKRFRFSPEELQGMDIEELMRLRMEALMQADVFKRLMRSHLFRLTKFLAKRKAGGRPVGLTYRNPAEFRLQLGLVSVEKRLIRRAEKCGMDETLHADATARSLIAIAFYKWLKQADLTSRPDRVNDWSDDRPLYSPSTPGVMRMLSGEFGSSTALGEAEGEEGRPSLYRATTTFMGGGSMLRSQPSGAIVSPSGRRTGDFEDLFSPSARRSPKRPLSPETLAPPVSPGELASRSLPASMPGSRPLTPTGPPAETVTIGLVSPPATARTQPASPADVSKAMKRSRTSMLTVGTRPESPPSGHLFEIRGRSPTGGTAFVQPEATEQLPTPQGGRVRRETPSGSRVVRLAPPAVPVALPVPPRPVSVRSKGVQTDISGDLLSVSVPAHIGTPSLRSTPAAPQRLPSARSDVTSPRSAVDTLSPESEQRIPRPSLRAGRSRVEFKGTVDTSEQEVMSPLDRLARTPVRKSRTSILASARQVKKEDGKILGGDVEARVYQGTLRGGYDGTLRSAVRQGTREGLPVDLVDTDKEDRRLRRRSRSEAELRFAADQMPGELSRPERLDSRERRRVGFDDFSATQDRSAILPGEPPSPSAAAVPVAPEAEETSLEVAGEARIPEFVQQLSFGERRQRPPSLQSPDRSPQKRDLQRGKSLLQPLLDYESGRAKPGLSQKVIAADLPPVSPTQLPGSKVARRATLGTILGEQEDKKAVAAGEGVLGMSVRLEERRRSDLGGLKNLDKLFEDRPSVDRKEEETLIAERPIRSRERSEAARVMPAPRLREVPQPLSSLYGRSQEAATDRTESILLQEALALEEAAAAAAAAARAEYEEGEEAAAAEDSSADEGDGGLFLTQMSLPRTTSRPVTSPTRKPVQLLVQGRSRELLEATASLPAVTEAKRPRRPELPAQPQAGPEIIPAEPSILRDESRPLALEDWPSVSVVAVTESDGATGATRISPQVESFLAPSAVPPEQKSGSVVLTSDASWKSGTPLRWGGMHPRSVQLLNPPSMQGIMPSAAPSPQMMSQLADESPPARPGPPSARSVGALGKAAKAKKGAEGSGSDSDLPVVGGVGQTQARHVEGADEMEIEPRPVKLISKNRRRQRARAARKPVQFDDGEVGMEDALQVLLRGIKKEAETRQDEYQTLAVDTRREESGPSPKPARKPSRRKPRRRPLKPMTLTLDMEEDSEEWSPVAGAGYTWSGSSGEELSDSSPQTRYRRSRAAGWRARKTSVGRREGDETQGGSKGFQGTLRDALQSTQDGAEDHPPRAVDDALTPPSSPPVPETFVVDLSLKGRRSRIFPSTPVRYGLPRPSHAPEETFPPREEVRMEREHAAEGAGAGMSHVASLPTLKLGALSASLQSRYRLV
ncbi:unnamed protein product [Vitrella brassicaformis CCMP3155]|uniref:Uncharacterized protein n=6 Tax=Vitrella brassicaformis TaxID=1169539 RepID=A0A0G4EM86_VITBC|nr:unnamed protein product [Vitrella brassicaformis CCMP3155]|eukprot:CEL98095.1 unnamed protein product [Vitrella brassicaformis CCMP3155]